MMGYAEDRRWSDRFIPEIKRLVGPHLLTVSSFEQDTKQAADLIVLRAEGVTLACRVRQMRYLTRYSDEFTIRSSRVPGTRTEIDKVRAGWGDWMFYGFGADDYPTRFMRWVLLDLAVWRRDESGIRSMLIDNHDGTYGAAYRVEDFGDDFVIAEGGGHSGAPHAAKEARDVVPMGR